MLPWRASGCVALLWMAVVCIESAALLGSDAALLRADLISWLSLLAINALCAGAFVGLLAIIAAIALPLLHRAKLRSLRNAVLLVILSGSASLVIGSWACFWGTGIFIGREAVQFGLAQSFQILHWVPGNLLLIVPIASVLAGAVAMAFISICWGRMSFRAHVRATLVGAMLIALCVATAYAGTPGVRNKSRELLQLDVTFRGGPFGSGAEFGQLYARAQRYTSGSFSAAFMGIMEMVRPSPASRVLSLTPEDASVIRNHPRLSTEEYLARPRQPGLMGRNVLLINVESLGIGPLQAYGRTGPAVMPNLDELARLSVVFERSYAQATHTNYSATSIVSAQYPLRTPDAFVYAADPPFPRVMPYDLLQPLGYRTGLFSSGNDLWGGMVSFWTTGHLDRLLYSGNFDGPTYVAQEDTGFARWVARTRNAGSIDDRSTTDELLRWIGDGSTDQPFLAIFAPQNSHFPYSVPKDRQRRFSRGPADFPFAFGGFPLEHKEDVIALYHDSLHYVDEQIGRIIAHLKDANLWDRTIVIVTGDHGQAFYEHGFATHGNALYQECLRVPFIVRAPGLQPSRASRPVQHVDIVPTMLALLGLPPHPGHQGWNALDPALADDRPIYCVVQTPIADQVAVIADDLKLIYDTRLDAYSLFDLAEDPEERIDLSRTRPTVAARLIERLQRWRRAQLDYYADPLKQRLTYAPAIDE